MLLVSVQHTARQTMHSAITCLRISVSLPRIFHSARSSLCLPPSFRSLIALKDLLVALSIQLGLLHTHGGLWDAQLRHQAALRGSSRRNQIPRDEIRSYSCFYHTNMTWHTFTINDCMGIPQFARERFFFTFVPVLPLSSHFTVMLNAFLCTVKQYYQYIYHRIRRKRISPWRDVEPEKPEMEKRAFIGMSLTCLPRSPEVRIRKRQDVTYPARSAPLGPLKENPKVYPDAQSN